MKQKKNQNGQLIKFKMAASKKPCFPAPPILNIFSWNFHGLVLGLVQGVSYYFDILWRPLRPPKNNFLVMMKAFVYSRGAVIWVSSISFLKSNISWPQQPPTAKIQNISEKLDFWWSIPQQGTSNGHFGARDDQTIMIRNFLEDIGLVRPMRLPRLLRSMRLQRFLGSWKSLLRTAESSSRFLNLMI